MLPATTGAQMRSRSTCRFKVNSSSAPTGCVTSYQQINSSESQLFIYPQFPPISLASLLPRPLPHQSRCHGYLETMEGAPFEVSGEKHTGALQQTVHAMAAHIDKLQHAQVHGAGCPHPESTPCLVTCSSLSATLNTLHTAD